MAWTATTLKAAVQDMVESDETTFVANLNILIKQAEDRILKDVQIPDFRKNVTGTMSADSQYVGIPDDFLAPYSLAVDSDTGADIDMDFLIFKDVSWIREVYPDANASGTPKYYSIWDDEFFLVAPTPDANYPVELHYFHKPTSIVDAGDGTSWLGTHAESCLFYASLVESYIFLKGDQDLIDRFEAQYQRSIGQMRVLAEGRSRTDQYRSGR